MKTSHSSGFGHKLLISASAAAITLFAANAYAVGDTELPTNLVSTVGNATVSTTSYAVPAYNQKSVEMTVLQADQKIIMTADTFSIGKDAAVRFVQPNSGSMALVKVDANAGVSQIDGWLFGNGNVWVVNPNGMIFGGGTVVAASGLLFSTNDIANSNFMTPTVTANGDQYVFDTDGRGAIVLGDNNPYIIAQGGGPNNHYVTFLSQAFKQGDNAGVEAPNGDLNIAVGQDFTVTVGNDGSQTVEIGAPVTAPVLVDGVMTTGVDLSGAHAWLYAAYTLDGSDLPQGKVTIQASATQSVFNSNVDTNSNGLNDPTGVVAGVANRPDWAGQQYTGSDELVRISDGMDIMPIRPEQPNDPQKLIIRSTIVPLPAPLAGVDEQLVNRKFDPAGRPVISISDSAQADTFGPVRTNYINYEAVRAENNLFAAGPTNPTTGALGELAPAAGGDASPSAGGDNSTACANEHLQDPLKKVDDEDSRCNVAQETNQAI